MRYNESIQLLQANGRTGASIVKYRYDRIRKIVDLIIREAGVISFDELSKRAQTRMSQCDGDHLMEAVITDLEARGIVECPMLNGQLFVKAVI